MVKIAVIDDNRSARESLALLICACGFEVLPFSSALEFLKDTRIGQVDCAVTDVQMPEIGDFKLQASLAEKVPYLSAVFIGGYGNIPLALRQ